jgi:LuxR family maltose regulon positive regulatory protein
MDRALRDSKISVPEPRRGAVSRKHLIVRACTSGSPIVAVTAPAGYGKSTLLAEWAASETRAVAWVSPDRFDDDPATLLSLVASACSRFSPLAIEAVADLSDMGGPALGRSAPLLAAALASTATPFALFIDDLHLVDSSGCRDVLEVLVGGVPAGSQVVFASRHEQAHLARLRVASDVFEVDADDLRVDDTGARLIFEDVGSDVSEDEIAQLVARCEGWPAGLFLCALISGRGGDPSATGDDRFIADYLYRECLAQLPDDLARFLRRTAVLERLSGDLCNAVLDRGDSHASLRALERLNLFLVPLDRHRGWYRYHGLFREFLLGDLHRLEGSDVPELHRRAASWCEANGLAHLAIDHLLTAGDQDRAAQLIPTAGLQSYRAGQVAVTSRWLAQLDETTLEAHPRVAVLACWKSLLMGESAEAERLAHVIERIQSPVDGGSGVELAAAQAAIRAAMCARGPQKALEDAAFAFANEPRWSPWHDRAAYLYGSAALLVEDVAAAREAFVEGSSPATAAGPLCLAELAVLALDEGAWPEATRLATAALEAIEANHMDGYSTSALGFAVAARIAVHDDDVARADELLAMGMRARVPCTHVLPFVALRSRLQLSKAYAARGDRAAVRALGDEMEDLLRARPDLGALSDEIARHRRETATLPGSEGAAPLSPAEFRLLPYLQTHLTLHEIGERLFVSRNTVSTQVTAIYRKLGVTSRGAAVRRAAETGLLSAAPRGTGHPQRPIPPAPRTRGPRETA